MRRSSALGDYLRARRALVLPEDVGLPSEPKRRVDGLRREEVARLAGISQEYYLRLEQGHDHQPSEQVLAALAGALRLDAVAQEHLFRLARPAPRVVAAPSTRKAIGAQLADLLDRWQDVVVVVADPNFDIVLTNALVDGMGVDSMSVGANILQGVFGVPSRLRPPQLEELQRQLAGALRRSGDPDDPRFREIVGDLSVRSPDFRRIWARQDVHELVEGECLLFVAPFGLMPFRWRTFAVAGYPGYTMTTIFAEAKTTAAGALAYIAARTSAVPVAS